MEEELQAEVYRLEQRIEGLLADAEKLTEERDLWRQAAEHYQRRPVPVSP